jgi:hypothetical protein
MTALEKYREVYAQFVTRITDLHNCNVLYSRQPSIRNGIDLRRILRDLRKVEKNLWDASVKASKEVSAARGPGRLPKKEKQK